MSAPGDVVVLAGGTGGAKLARGMSDVVGPERLVAIANTGDDIEIYGAHVSPDPDLISFWLADRIDERGWGLHADTFEVMDALRALGSEVWFNLGDRDLAWCVERARMLAEGLSATAALQRLNESIGVRARVLPATDDALRTWVRTSGGWRSFQEFMIRDRAAGAVDGLEFRGAEQARPSEQVLAAIAGAHAIVIGPSNPLASIAPILAVPGMREALKGSAAPVVAVSPIVGGEVLKGPTAAFMAFAALECDAGGVADFYGELLDGIVADEDANGQPASLRMDTRMDDARSRAAVAEQTLGFAEALAG
ncbi:MAG: 2-phospho-L-lactate transferase [Gaiellales bacterium]|nr:2-phospho-L-lactate transferase [Gaiellales bacterium]